MQDLFPAVPLLCNKVRLRLERCGATKAYRSHKGRHKGFTLFSSQEHHQGAPSSPLKVLFKVAQPLHKARVTPQHGGSQLHHGVGSRLQPPGAQTTGIPPTGNSLQQEFPQQETPYKDPPNRRSRVTRFPNRNCSDPKFLW